jgi:glutathionylspermidine synthase
MRRIAIAPRPDFRERAEKLGFDFAEIDGEPYWDETAYWRFSSAEIDVLDDATAELQRLCLAAAEHAVRNARHDTLGIPPHAWPLVVRSFEAREPSLYGRMDLRWDGSGAPKLLEYNADTPTALYEASVVQWEWLTTVFPGADQFNSIHERLIDTWRTSAWPMTIHFSCMPQSTEDCTTIEYCRDTAVQAGKQAPFLALQNIGWDGATFLDLGNRPIAACFKLYPWEFLLADRFGAHVGQAATRWIEPAWRLLLSGKGLLALLWELFPGHPNLLPAFREPGRTGGPEIAKPLFAREGANITAPGQSTGGPYGAQGRVFQRYAELPCVDGRYPVLGSWVVGGVPCGLGIREDATPITTDASRFVPHCFDPPGKDCST